MKPSLGVSRAMLKTELEHCHARTTQLEAAGDALAEIVRAARTKRYDATLARWEALWGKP